MKKIEDSFMAKLFSTICSRLDLKLKMGPKMGAYGQIESGGKRISFYNCCFDINPYGSSILTRNKGLTRLILESEKIIMPKGKYFSFDTDEYENSNTQQIVQDISVFVNTLKFPIMVKGADLHRGTCIFKINLKEELTEAVCEALKMTKGAIIEEFIDFPIYRVIVFNGKVIAIYRKDHFQIMGNGKSKVLELIKEGQEICQKKSIGTDFTSMESEILKKLIESKYTEDSILPKGEKIILTDSACISRGGMAVDCTNLLTDEFKKYCEKICKLLNLRLCGIDILSKNISNAPRESYLLEVNSSPCLETYSKLGNTQKKIIENLMENIISKGLMENGF